MNTFFELLQVAAGTRDSISSLPSSREEWEALFKVTGQHNLLGVTFPVIDELHDEADIPLSVYSRWAMAAEKIEQKNVAHKEACRKIYSYFSDNGFRSCIFKGQTVARLYPRPELRQCGDIDIWLEGDRHTVVDFLRSKFVVHKIVYHHCDVKMIKGIGVEVHFTPSWMNSFSSNRRLQQWFVSQAGEQFSNFDGELGFNVPTVAFDAVYMLIHIYRHVLDEGIGLRQLLDYYYVLEHLDSAARSRALGDIRYLKLEKFAAAVMYVLGEVFLLDDSLMLCAPDESEGAFLLSEIMASGNFGKFDIRNAHSSSEGLIGHGKRKVSRGLRYLWHYPSEVLAMPLFMCWQYFWRRKHNYLYKGR